MPIRVQVVGHGLVEFPDGTSQEEMQKALASLAQPDADAQAKPTGQRAEGSTFGEKISNAAKMIGGALPVVGGVVGGAVAGVPGAAIGGAVGQGYKQLAQHASEIPGAVADVARNLVSHPVETAEGFVGGTNQGGTTVAGEAAGQAVGQAAGTALAERAISPLSKWLMGRATTRVTQKLMQDFPELNDTLIDNALSVSKGGYGKAYSMLMTAKGKANAALKAADAAGAMVPVQMTDDLAQSLKTAVLEKIVKSGKMPAPPAGQPLTVATERLDPTTRALFTKVEQAAQSGSPLDLTPSQADLLKTQLQKESRALYANRTAPNGPKAMGMDATERAEFATALNNAIDGIANGYKAGNAEAKPLIGAVRGIKQAMRPNGNLYQAMVRPAVGGVIGGETGRREGGTAGAALGAVAGGYAMSPSGMSHAAIILANPATAHLLSALPKSAAAYLISLLEKDQVAQPPDTGVSK